MLKLKITIISLLFCGIASAQGVYTPATPTIYGEQQLRYKPFLVQHLPMKDELTVNTNDTTAQLFILKSDLSLWQYTFTGGFVKITGSGGGGGGGGTTDPLIIDVIGPYLEAVDDHTLNAKGWGIQNVLDTGHTLNKDGLIDVNTHKFTVDNASQIDLGTFDLGAGGVVSALSLQANDVNVTQIDNANNSKLSFPSSANLQGNHYIPLSVGGVFADETGNIPGGGGGGSTPDLQAVTDAGATTNVPLTILNASVSVADESFSKVANLTLGASSGILRLQNTGGYAAYIQGSNIDGSDRTIEFPNADGTLVATINGNHPDANGNISISGGGGGSSGLQDVTDAGAFTTNNFGAHQFSTEISQYIPTAVLKTGGDGAGSLELQNFNNPILSQKTIYGLTSIKPIYSETNKINFPFTLSADHYLPLSVDGHFAGDDGNIVTGGGGGAEGLQDVTDISPVTTAVIQAAGYNVYNDPTTQVAALAPGLNFGLVDGVLTLKSTNTNVAVVRPAAALAGSVSLVLPSSSGTLALLSDITAPSTTNTVKGEPFTGSTSSTITLAHTYTSGTISVYKNGVRISGFTEATGTTLTLTDARLSGDTFLIDYNY